MNDGIGAAALRGAWLGRFASDVRDREAAAMNVTTMHQEKNVSGSLRNDNIAGFVAPCFSPWVMGAATLCAITGAAVRLERTRGTCVRSRDIFCRTAWVCETEM